MCYIFLDKILIHKCLKNSDKNGVGEWKLNYLLIDSCQWNTYVIVVLSLYQKNSLSSTQYEILRINLWL